MTISGPLHYSVLKCSNYYYQGCKSSVLEEDDGIRHDDDDDTTNIDTNPTSSLSIVSLSATNKIDENEVTVELMMTHFPYIFAPLK